jgi:TRAP-type mannitol/chloroaromatic compound transport system substrate-binding protein
MRKRALVSTTLLLSSLILSGGTGFAADNEVKEKNINIKISAAIPTSLPVLKTIHDFAENLSTMSNGSIKAKVYDPGKLVPAMEIHDAVSKGQVTAGYTFSMYLAGKIPASPLFASMPFGPSANAYTAWLFEGNGLDLYQRMYDEAGYNVKVFPIGISDTESGGWFRQEINTVEDLKGLRLRWGLLSEAR